MNSPISARPAVKSVQRLTLDAMLLAFVVVMGYLPSALSWQSLPIFLCAYLIGPLDAVIIALLGSFLEQLQYGLSAQSLIWMFPWLLFGIFAALSALLLRKTENRWLLMLFVVLAELLLNIGNTTAMLWAGYLSVSSLSPLVLIPFYALRMVPFCIIRAILSAVGVPLLLPPLRRVLQRLNR